MSRITALEVRAIRELYELGCTQTQIAAMYDLTQQQVSAIVRRVAWAHVR